MLQIPINVKGALLAIIDNSDLRHGLEFDYNQEAWSVRDARLLIDPSIQIAFCDDFY